MTQQQEFENVDLGWQPEPLHEEWPSGRDTDFMLWRMEEAFEEVAVAGIPGRMLDVACGNAFHAAAFHDAGWRVYGLEPSPEMVRRALSEVEGKGARIDMARGIGEALPFRDASFDRVVCMSSLDHFADPAKGVAEMARVVAPEGRVVLGIVNYGGVGCRSARAIYRVQRRLGMKDAGKRLFWDDPTVSEHTFEGSLHSLRGFAAGRLELESASGVSMLWAVPGWGKVVGVVGKIPGTTRPARVARDAPLRALDALARRFPGGSDFLITTWRKA